MSKFKVGDRVIGKAFSGRGRWPLVVIEVKKGGLYQCQVVQTNESATYLEDGIETDTRL